MSLSNIINRLADTADNISNTVLNSVSNLLGKTDAQSGGVEKTSKSYFADWYGKFMAQTPAAKTDVYRQVFIPQAAKLDFTDNDVKAQLKQEAAKFHFSGEDKNKQSAATAGTNGVNQSNGSGDKTEVFVVGLRKSPLDAHEISEAIIKQLKFTAQDIKDYQAKYDKDPRTNIYNIVNHCLIDPRCKKEGLENFPKPAKSGELLSAPHNVTVENIPISVTKPLHDFIKTQRQGQTAEYAAQRQNLKDNSPALIARDTGKQIAETVKKNAPTLLATTTAGLGTAADLVLRQPIPLPTVADIAKNMKLVIGGGGALLEAAPPIAAGTALITGALATGKQYLGGQVDNKLDEIAKANRERMLAEPLPPFTMTMDDAEPLPQPIPDGKAKERPFAEPIAPTIPNIETAPPPKPGDLVKPETTRKPETTVEELPQPYTPDVPKGTPPQSPKRIDPRLIPPTIIGGTVLAKLTIDKLSEGEKAELQKAGHTLPSLPPDAARMPKGSPEKVDVNEAPENILAITKQNESAVALSRVGYDVEQLKPNFKLGVAQPDYKIEGKEFDHYAPTSSNARSIYTTLKDKIEKGQASRFVVNLDNSSVSIEKLTDQFNNWKLDGLEEIILIKGTQVTPFFPFSE